MAKGTRRAGSQFDQTYLDTDSSIEVHRDYLAHAFRWGFAARFLPGKRVLDAGCGGNFMLGRVAIDHGRMLMRPEHYVGVDLSPLPPVRTMHKTVIGDFNFIERRQELIDHFGKFDVVTSFEVVEHMPTEAGHAFLRAMRECLKPDGLMLLSTPKNEGAKMAKNHIHEWSGAELQAGLEQAGLRVEKRFGTYADVKQLEKAAREEFPQALDVLQRLSEYYCNDVLSCFLAPLFPDASKNNIWLCRHPDPATVSPGPAVPADKLARSWPVSAPSDPGVLNQNTKGLPKNKGENDGVDQNRGRAEEETDESSSGPETPSTVDRRGDLSEHRSASPEDSGSQRGETVAGRSRTGNERGSSSGVDPRGMVSRGSSGEAGRSPDSEGGEEVILDAELVEDGSPDHTAPRGPEPDVLSINSYAGSLLIGARLAGAKITASYEDCGYGSEWQAKNFPDIPLVWKREGWPDTSLEDKVVIAHPPCAAFSLQAIGTRLKYGVEHGLKNGAFSETVEVVEYALSHRALAIAVESVQPALEGGRYVLDEIADKHGYHLGRVLQNAATFGIPQWRPRYWAIFWRKDLGPRFATWHTPAARTVRQVLDGVEPGPSDADQDRRLQTQRELLDKLLGAGAADAVLSTPGMIARTIQRLYRPEVKDLMEITAPYCVGTYEKVGTQNPKQRRFMSATIRVLDPDGYTNVLVRDTWWVYEGRNVTPAEYRALMGFPTDYILDKNFRTWLSKGVVPQVAQWVLELMRANVSGNLPAGVAWLKSGDTVNYQIDKKVWKDLAQGKKVSDPYHLRPLEDPNLFKKPRGVELLGPDAVVVESLDHDEPVDNPAAKVQDPVVVKREPGSRKKRVQASYVLTPHAAIDERLLIAAFDSPKAVVQPLVSYTWDGELINVVAQYEPPNAGGSRTDVDRIVNRAAKKLGAEWSRA